MRLARLSPVIAALTFFLSQLVGQVTPVGRPELDRVIQSIADDKQRDSALERLWEIGSPAMPAVIRAWSDQDSRVRKYSLLATDVFLATHPQVIADFPAYAEDLRVALPILIERFRDEEEIRELATWVLASIVTLGPRNRLDIGSVIVQEMVDRLDDPDELIRVGAATTLGELFGSVNPEIPLPPLIAKLTDKNPRVRVGVASAIGGSYERCQAAHDCRENYAAAIPGLMSALDDADQKVRVSAALSLAAIEPASKAAIPALVDAVKTSGYKALFARTTLISISPVDAIRVFVGIIESNEDTSGLYKRELSEMRAIVESLSADPNPEVREYARAALALIGR